jgi:transcriptional regulator with GAF, ATPase, and Fis domain
MAAVAAPQLVRSGTRILVASANSSFRRQLLESPLFASSHGEEAVGGAHALAKLVQFSSCDSVLLDRNLPDLDAGEVAEIIRKRYPRIEIEFVDSRIESAQAEETGNPDVEKVANSGGNITDTRYEEPLTPRHAGQDVHPLPAMIGSSRAIQHVYRLARMVAPRDTTVLITGETGTGKELVAEAIHQISARARHPFVVVNCAAIPEALLEAELFGHARGAFTGAVQSRLGRIHVAQGGTLFLDEIGELPLSMQAKLLRFLQNGEVQRLGSPDVYKVDVRVVCATNVRLLDLVPAKQFRQDLYYRLAIFPIAMPPLRERAEDIGALAGHFLAQLSADAALSPKRLGAGALAFLQQAHWAGNVRELHHSIERAFILAGNEPQLHTEHFQAFHEGIELREI